MATVQRRKRSNSARNHIPLLTDEEVAAIIKKVSGRWFLENRNLDYMIYANTDRAIPLATSGVKLGAQRLLYSMLRDKVLPGSKPRKSAKIASSATGSYHPHASSSMYGTLVTLAQPFARIKPVEGIGAFGMTPGDTPAADRYTEARLSELGYAMVREVDDGAVPMKPTYDNENLEPLYLPVPVPILLCSGANGIGNGWSTSTPAHNPREVCAATLAVLDNPEITTSELMEHMPGPDWGTGGAVIGGTQGIRDYYDTGAGKLKVRGTWHIEGKDIVITEVPPGVSVPTLLDGTKKGDNPRLGLRDLVRQGVIGGIADVSDLSDLNNGLKIVVTCKRGADPQDVVGQILAETELERTYGANMVALGRDLVPDWWSLRELLDDFIKLRDHVIQARSTQRLEVLALAASRASAVAAVTLDKDTTVKLITDSEDKTAAAHAVAAHFQLTQDQGTWIIEMPLHRLTKADTLEAQKRLEKLQTQIAELEQLLASPAARQETIRTELVQTSRLFDDPSYDRRTRISPETQPIAMALEESDEERLQRWKLDTDNAALGDVGQDIHNAHAVWVAFVDGKIKKFRGGGLPKKMTLKPVAPDVARIHSCGLYTPETQDILLVTSGTNKSTTAKALRIRTEDMRAQGLAGNGVAGIKLLEGDHLVAAFPVTQTDLLLTSTDTGFKVTRVSDIPVKGTGSQGVGIHRLRKDDTGLLLAQVAPGFRVNGAVATATGIAGAAGKTPLREWDSFAE